MLRAGSVAIVGASERSRWGSLICRNLQQNGYAGRVFLINPNQKEVFGERCYPSLRELSGQVEHAMLIVPAPAIQQALLDAEAAGVKSATIYAAAIGDGDSEKSQERGRWLRQFLANTPMRIGGPNCMGAHSYRERLFAYPNAELCTVPPGPVGCIFQSGGTLQFWLRSAADRGLRFSYGISSGNEFDVDLADYLNFLVEDDDTRQIVLFVEGIRRPAAFMRAAGRALAAGKPIIAIKTGATARSQSAAQSHTGAIGGDYAAYLAMCERYGIINCRTLEDLLEITLAFQPNRLPRGPRVGFVTSSGGTVDLLYDYAEFENVALADLTSDTNAKLEPFMQEGIAPKNPLDVGLPSTLKAAADVCEIVARDPNVDMLAWGASTPGKGNMWNDAGQLRRLLGVTDKPVLAFGRMVYQMTPASLAVQDAAGFPFLQSLEPTLRALNALWFYAQRRGHAPLLPPSPPASDLCEDNLEATLARYGIALPKSRFAATAAQAGAEADSIGYPVALKIQSPDILHKTEARGVKLGLDSREAVQAAADALLASAKAGYPQARIEGFLVQEMVSGVEAIVGARHDPIYGPLLLIGTGGVLVELVRDASLRLLPVDDPQVRKMIGSLKLQRLLDGFRGQDAFDRVALETTALSLARFFLDHRRRIRDIEINPLIVRASGAVAVDVRVIWNDDDAAR
jgi:acetyltransferase